MAMEAFLTQFPIYQTFRQAGGSWHRGIVITTWEFFWHDRKVNFPIDWVLDGTVEVWSAEGNLAESN